MKPRKVNILQGDLRDLVQFSLRQYEAIIKEVIDVTCNYVTKLTLKRGKSHFL
jgi:hypothetical protein